MEEEKEPKNEEQEEGQLKHQEKKREIKEAFKQLEEAGQFDVWYSCDGWIKPINPGKFRFDWKICENFTFCEKCFKNNDSHAHPFKKKKVPVSYAPPENNEELLEKAFVLCHHCRRWMIRSNEKVFECKTWECFIWKVCKKNHNEIEIESGNHEIVVSKEFKEDTDKKDNKEDKKEYLEGVLDEYYKLGFEDIIGKDIYTRFKYTKVKEYDFGLTNEEILLLNDKELNKLVSLKKYKPYRNDEELTNLHRVKSLKNKLSKKVDDEKHQLKQILKQDIKIQKEKLLGMRTDGKEIKRGLIKNARIKDKLEDKKLRHELKEEQKKQKMKRKLKESNKDQEEGEENAVDQNVNEYKRDRKSLYLL